MLLIKNGYIICGDNRGVLEKDVKESDIIGVLDGFYQGDRYIDHSDDEFINYGITAVKGLTKRRIKRFFGRVKRKIKRIFK